MDGEFCFHGELKSLFAKSTASPDTGSLSKLKNIGDVKLALISGIFLNYPKSKVDMVLVVNNYYNVFLYRRIIKYISFCYIKHNNNSLYLIRIFNIVYCLILKTVYMFWVY